MSKLLFYSMTMNSGGAERVVANLANEFILENEVAIATLTNSNVDYCLNNRIALLHSSKKNNSSLLSRFINIFTLLKNTKKYEPDIVIAFCPTMCFIACFFKIFIKKLKKAKLIISERNNPESEYNNSFLKHIANYLYSKADVVVFQNNGAKSFFCKKVQDIAVVIPNPISDKFISVKKDIKKDNSIVNVGRLEPQKNQELLIRTCSKIFKYHTGWKLKIYGEGSLKDKLLKLIKDLKMERNIFIMGKCLELEKELPKNKIFVLSSDYEGMPNALMEAMACGLACISTDCPCGGPKDLIVNDENGLLVSVGSEEELEKKINELIINKKKFEKICLNSKNIISKYSNENIISKWKNVLFNENIK